MPGNCEAVGCTNHTKMRENKPSFHRFPQDSERRTQWTIALRKLNRDGSKWTPAKSARICGQHFINGKPNHADPNHPDYVPSIFKHKPPQMSAKKMDRYNSLNRRRLQYQESQENHNDPEMPDNNDEVIRPPTDLSAAEALLDLMATPGPSRSESNESPSSFSTPVTPTERTMFHDEMNALRSERDTAQNELKQEKDKSEKTSLRAGSVRNNDVKCRNSTGLSWTVFITTFNFLSLLLPSARQHRNVMPLMDQYFITLVKLRTGINFDFLATHTGVGKTSVIEIFWKWIDLMYVNLGFLLRTPDTEAVRRTLPPAIKTVYPRLTCIVDCFEIFIDQATKLKARAQTYSNYKKHNTVKVFIGCTPLGAVSFISTAWGGRVSDVELIRKCGFISPDIHMPGDQILADRGFQVQEDFAIEVGAEFIIPAFTRGKNQLSAQEVETSRRLASIRIHIERVIGALKNRFKILEGPLPINLIKSLKEEAMDVQLARIDKLIKVCACLLNLGDGIVYKEKKE